MMIGWAARAELVSPTTFAAPVNFRMWKTGTAAEGRNRCLRVALRGVRTLLRNRWRLRMRGAVAAVRHERVGPRAPEAVGLGLFWYRDVRVVSCAQRALVGLPQCPRLVSFSFFKMSGTNSSRSWICAMASATSKPISALLQLRVCAFSIKSSSFAR